MARPGKSSGNSSATTALIVLLALAVVVLSVMLATRHDDAPPSRFATGGDSAAVAPETEEPAPSRPVAEGTEGPPAPQPSGRDEPPSPMSTAPSPPPPREQQTTPGPASRAPTPPVDAGGGPSAVSPSRSGPPPADSTFGLRQQIRQSFGGAREAFRACYEESLAAVPNLSDRLVVELSVMEDPRDGEDGLVELISITSEEMAIDDVECFALAVEDLAMPSPQDGEPYTIRYPLILSTTGPGDVTPDAGLQ